jgi:hypothetical protein
VDVDGNGFQPNGDTLGYDLPAGGLTVDEAKRLLTQSVRRSSAGSQVD